MMKTTRKLATASLALLAVAAVAAATSLGVLAAAVYMPALQDDSPAMLYRPNRPAADFTPPVPADQFRVVIEEGACGVPGDDLFYVSVWYGNNHWGESYLPDQIAMVVPNLGRWQFPHSPERRGSVTAGAWDWDLSDNIKKEMAATLRRVRQGSESMHLALHKRVPFPGLLDILDVMRFAGFRCVYIELVYPDFELLN